jgi:hypothetical protein
MEIQIGRNKIQGARNKIKIQRNEIKEKRKRIQIAYCPPTQTFQGLKSRLQGREALALPRPARR